MPCGIQHRPASSQMLGKAALSLILLKNKWGIGNTSEACMQRLQGGSVPVIMLGGKPTSSLVMIRRCGLSQSPPCVWPLEAGPLYPTGQACHVLCSPFPRPWTTWGQWSSSSFIKELFNGFFSFLFFFFPNHLLWFWFPSFFLIRVKKKIFSKDSLQFLVVICAIIKIFSLEMFVYIPLVFIAL